MKKDEGSQERLTENKYADLEFQSPPSNPYSEQRIEYVTVGHTSFSALNKQTDV